jgi:hypothetical protein
MRLEQTLCGAKIAPNSWELMSNRTSDEFGVRQDTHMLIHVFWYVGDVEIGVALVRELLQLGIEGFLCTVRKARQLENWGLMDLLVRS